MELLRWRKIRRTTLSYSALLKENAMAISVGRNISHSQIVGNSTEGREDHLLFSNKGSNSRVALRPSLRHLIGMEDYLCICMLH